MTGVAAAAGREHLALADPDDTARVAAERDDPVTGHEAFHGRFAFRRGDPGAGQVADRRQGDIAAAGDIGHQKVAGGEVSRQIEGCGAGCVVQRQDTAGVA